MESDPQEIVEEIINKETGEKTIRKYHKMNPSEKNGKKYYKFIDSESQEKFTAEITPKSELEKETQKQMFINGLKIHKSCKHSNIATMKRLFKYKDNYYTLFEYCKNGTIDDLLNERKILTEIEIKYYLKQLINALLYLHKSKIIHRNLKLKNILLTKKFEIKLTGFKYSVKKTNDDEKFFDKCGTPKYIAPEIMTENIGYSYEVDIWALGIIIYKDS